MMIIYIASPYTMGDVGQNVRVQIEAAHQIMDAGHCPIAPLLNHYLHIHRPRQYEEWLRMDLKLLSKADVLVRLHGLSIGADKEVGYATSVGIPVFHTIEDAIEYCDATELCNQLGIDKPMV